MYIKSVTVHGFKSYKEPTTIYLSPQCNVVVGRNGAGKSNFFAAIRFVLGDIFTNLRAEERQQLLHEGAGLAVMTAYVELVFDNSDNRFPVRSNGVAPRAPRSSLRRSVRQRLANAESSHPPNAHMRALAVPADRPRGGRAPPHGRREEGRVLPGQEARDVRSRAPSAASPGFLACRRFAPPPPWF